MTVAGKAVTGAFYPGKLHDSYFFGCSTGGREGLMEAQRYPADCNGIVSGAPAINWTRFIPAEIWPALVMNQMHDALPTCKEDAFTDAAVMNKIWQGPVTTSGRSLWYGPERGASLAGLAATTTTNGVTTPSPFPITASWLGTWLPQNPN